MNADCGVEICFGRTGFDGDGDTLHDFTSVRSTIWAPRIFQYRHRPIISSAFSRQSHDGMFHRGKDRDISRRGIILPGLLFGHADGADIGLTKYSGRDVAASNR